MSIENPEQKETLPNKEKPKFLYHGSAHKNIEELEPRNKSVRDDNEGPVVFATQELSLAAIFMAEKTKNIGFFGDVPYCVILASREEFARNDKGGHIYVVPSDNFETDPKKGLGDYEWTSKGKVKVTEKIEYASVLEAMIENGAQVYFVDHDIYKKIKESKDHGLAILQNLESENQRIGKNIKPLVE